LAVVEDGVGFPYAFGFFAADLGEIGGGAAPGPVLPALDVAVFDGVVVSVVERGPEVAIGADGAFDGVEPALAAAAGIFAIPCVACAAVELGEGVEERFGLVGLNENVVVVGEDGPGEELLGVEVADIQEIGFESGQAVGSVADDGGVFVAGGGDEEAAGAGRELVRRGVPGAVGGLAVVEDLGLFLGGEFAPGVHWRLLGRRGDKLKLELRTKLKLELRTKLKLELQTLDSELR
jgi:hypothetical protein